MRTYTKVRLIKREDVSSSGDSLGGSFEVRTSTWFYFDNNTGRNAITGHATEDQALEAAKVRARAERQRSRLRTQRDE